MEGTPSLSLQRQMIEHFLAGIEQNARRKKDTETLRKIETAMHGCRTLAWIERRAELIRKVYALEQAEPLLAEIVGLFPGATLREIT